jgi:hypothetical protein
VREKCREKEVPRRVDKKEKVYKRGTRNMIWILKKKENIEPRC